MELGPTHLFRGAHAMHIISRDILINYCLSYYRMWKSLLQFSSLRLCRFFCFSDSSFLFPFL